MSNRDQSDNPDYVDPYQDYRTPEARVNNTALEADYIDSKNRWVRDATAQQMTASRPNIYEREIQHWKSLAKTLMKERELKIEPKYICAVWAEKISLGDKE